MLNLYYTLNILVNLTDFFILPCGHYYKIALTPALTELDKK